MTIKESGIEYIGYLDPWDEERLTDKEVVRCMDCRHYADHEWIIVPEYGLGTDVEHVCHFWHGEPTKVEADGFCAWGERREG